MIDIHNEYSTTLIDRKGNKSLLLLYCCYWYYSCDNFPQWAQFAKLASTSVRFKFNSLLNLKHTDVDAITVGGAR